MAAVSPSITSIGARSPLRTSFLTASSPLASAMRAARVSKPEPSSTRKSGRRRSSEASSAFSTSQVRPTPGWPTTATGPGSERTWASSASSSSRPMNSIRGARGPLFCFFAFFLSGAGPPGATMGSRAMKSFARTLCWSSFNRRIDIGRRKGLKARATMCTRGLFGAALSRPPRLSSARPSVPASGSISTRMPPWLAVAGAMASALKA